MKKNQLTVRLPQQVTDRLDDYVAADSARSRAGVILEALDIFLPVMQSRRAEPGAGQNAETGRAGNEFGVTAGRKLAEKLGRLLNPTATEFRMPDGRVATLRTARNRNTQWGCLDSVLERVDTIFCAHTKDDKHFRVWEIDPAVWKKHARPASAGHKLHGKLTLVGKSLVEEYGQQRSDQII